MSFLDVLQACRDSGIRLAAKGDKLVLGGAEGRLTPALRERIVQHKAEILAWLNRDEASVAGIQPQAPREHYPLSFAQQRLWFIDQLEDQSSEYNIPVAFGLKGALDVEALQGALDAIVARHAVLRTVFRLKDGEAAQVVRPFEPVAIRRIDLTGLDPAAQSGQVRALTTEEAGRRFDLSWDLMLRCTLIALAEQSHVVLFTMHHIASDGTSMGVLIGEFVRLYEALRAGRPEEAALAPLPIQYADFACWQRESSHGGLLEKELGYWRARLDGAPTLHGLPLDRPRPPRQRFDARRHEQALPKPLLDGLNRLAREHDATLFMVLQGAYAALLSRFSGERDIVMAVPNGGRGQRELAPLIGFFVNTLAFRSDVPPDLRLDELVVRARQTALAAFAHANIPYEMLTDALKLERNLAYNPLCQIKFVLQNHDAGRFELSGLQVESAEQSPEKVHFDLDLSAVESEHGLHLNWTYKDDLFDAARIERMAAAYARLLAQMVARPDARLDELVWVDEDEAAQLRALGQGPRSAARRDSVLPAQIAAQAARTPEAVAVRFGGSELSYAALERASNRLAQVLAEQGMGPGARVGVHLERSLALPIALLAVMKSGAAYVPLDHRQTPQRLQAIVEDAGIDVVLLDSAHATLPIRGLDTVFVDDAGTDPDWLDGYADEAPRVALSDEDSAYVLYTSGSTGTPKGVEIRHGGLIDYCAFALEGYYAAELAGSLVVTSPAFDLTIPSLYVPLLGGGCVELMPAQDELSALTERLEGIDAPASLLRMTPSHAHGLLQLADAAPREQAHAFVIGGEAFPVELARALQAKYPHARIYNHYGPTETVVGCAWFDVSANLATLERTIPIGRPMSNTRFYVMDPSGRLQPPGVAGELYIGGAGVAKGYLNRPELSAEKFLADPFDAHARVYRSGDRVVWRGDGTLEFLGRLDDQVKLRGFRIELGDIESALLRHDEVREAVAMVRGEDRDARLVAYVVATEADDSLVARLQAHASEQLPIYMQPSAIVVLDRLPLTINGKVDKRALPEPEQVATEFVAPHNDTERALAAIWERVLRVEAIGRHDHFFELGGHSLMATRVVSDIARRFGKPLPVRALFEHATIARLGAYLDAQAHSGHSDIPRIGRDRPLPLSFAQQRLWFIDRLEGNSSQYNMPAALKFAGQLDVAALRHAMDRLVERHEVLRTTYAERDGEAVQQVQPAGPVPLRIIDLRGLEDAERKQRLDALIEEEAAHPFDLSRDLMLRVTLIPLTDNEQALLFTLHHIASDGWSMDVLVREFKALYAGHVEGRVPALADLPVQYADYAAWQRERLHGAGLQAQLDYWRGHLAGLPPVHSLPLDRPRPPRQHFAGGRINHDLDRATVDALAALGRRHEASLFMVLEAAFAALLSRWSGEDDIAVGTLIAGRVHQDIEPLIGFFVNTLVLRTDLSGDPDFIAVLTQTRTRALAAYEHQDVPFEMLVEELKPARSLAHNPLFQIAFSMRNNEQPVLELPGMAVAPLSKNEAELAMFDLQLSATEHERGMRLSWLYAQHLFDGASIERLSAAYLRLLEGVLATPDAPMSELALLSDGDQQLIEQWNDRAQAYDRDATIHAVFEAQAAATPEASALIYDGAHLSYAELNRQANRIAHRLIAHGVKPGDNVGLCIERSFELIAATLGILKAGAAYVPFDPSYPQTRTAYMLEDSAVALVLTQSWLRDTLPEGVATLALDEDASLVQQPEHDPRLPMAASELCYVMYTSGSTGRPKGVQLPHRVIVNLIRSMIRGHAEVAQLTPTLQFATMNFDMSIYDIVSAFFTGSPLVMIAEEDRIDLPRLIAILRRERIGRVYLPTALLQPLTHVLLSERIELPDLQVVQVAGEALVITPTIREWAAHSGCPVLNLYGPTETHVVSDYRLDGDARLGRWLPCLGAPIDNARLYVLDAQRRSLPVGVVGELYIGGEDVLARGYLNRPELTEERFIADPFVAGARMYKTGDLVRWRADGTIEYLGRSDTQVKLRGFRIELGEIETVLARHAQVTDVVVTAQGEGGDKRLIAYVVSDATDHDALRAQLRQQLEAELPPYMQPSATVVLDRLPLTANGKVDTRALPAPEWQGRDYLPPQTPTEIALAQIWAELLGLDASAISVEANFFDIGGHSILAIKLVSLIGSRFSRALAIRELFQHPSVRELAAHIDGDQQRGDWNPLLRLSAEPDAPTLYCVPAAGMGAASYQPLARALRGRLSLSVFEPRGFDGRLAPSTDAAEIVAANLQALLQADPHGPYRIAGHSFGGSIAFEMAQALTAMGRPVELLLLDSRLYLPESERAVYSATAYKQRLLSREWEGGAAPQGSEDDQFQAVFERKMRQRGVLPGEGGGDVLDAIVGVFDAQLVLHGRFVPSAPLSAPVAVLLAREGGIVRIDRAELLRHYQAFCPGVEAVELVEGGHLSMLTSAHVASLADAIVATLTRPEEIAA